MKKLLFALPILLQVACNQGENTCNHFDLNHPKEVIKLPSQLKEISGITFLSKNKIVCIQDEKGTVFIYDIKKDKLKESVEFGKNKDYEAIANVNDTIYVLRSNGNIYEIDALESEQVVAITHNTFLSKENNCEGMCYDSKQNRLLIVCKGNPEKGSAPKYQKAVYAFDLSTKSMSKIPVLVFNPADIIKMANKISPDSFSFFNETRDKDKFDPSEISIEPETGNYFILSSVGKRLAVFSPQGDLQCAVNLDPEIFKQPEGLAFTESGDLVISDEGKKGRANLVIVGRKPRSD